MRAVRLINRPTTRSLVRKITCQERKLIPRHLDRTTPKLAHIQPRSTTPTTKRSTVPVSLSSCPFNPLPHNKSQDAPPLPPPPPGRRRRNHNSNTTPRTPKTPKTTPSTSFHTRNKDRPEWSPDKNGMRKPFNQPQPQSILAFRLLAISLLTTCNQNRRNVTRDTARRLHKRNGVQ